jgi:hypothetical protein
MTTLLSVAVARAVTAALGPVFSSVDPGPETFLVQANSWVLTSLDGVYNPVTRIRLLQQRRIKVA